MAIRAECVGKQGPARICTDNVCLLDDLFLRIERSVIAALVDRIVDQRITVLERNGFPTVVFYRRDLLICERFVDDIQRIVTLHRLAVGQRTYYINDFTLDVCVRCTERR